MTLSPSFDKHFSPTYWEWKVQISEESKSLVEFLTCATALPPNTIKDLIYFGSVHIDGRKEHDPFVLVHLSQTIRLYWPWHGTNRFYEINPQHILYRDECLLAYNKEAGIPSQQIPSDSYNNVYHGIIRYLKREGDISPYVAIHHRLDQETSGVILFAITKNVNRQLSTAFRERHIVKEYLLWAEGIPPDTKWIANQDITKLHKRYTWTEPGRGKAAETLFRVIMSNERHHLLLALPKTGRTHQIRIHALASGLKILGDRLYGGSPRNKLLLHAYRVSLEHPLLQTKITITAPLPHYWPKREAVESLLTEGFQKKFVECFLNSEGLPKQC